METYPLSATIQSKELRLYYKNSKYRAQSFLYSKHQVIKKNHGGGISTPFPSHSIQFSTYIPYSYNPLLSSLHTINTITSKMIKLTDHPSSSPLQYSYLIAQLETRDAETSTALTFITRTTRVQQLRDLRPATPHHIPLGCITLHAYLDT